MLTNKNNLNLAMQVWLINDSYDYVSDPKYISATSLLKPVRQIILEKRLEGSPDGDISDMITSKYGTSIHSGIEEAWTSPNLPDNLRKLGINETTIERIKINPSEPKEGDINIFLEKRSTRKINGWTVGGKFDLVIDGKLYDNKSTSTWSYIYGSRVEDYTKQLSIYRWLNTDLVTDDHFTINYIFTDWSQTKAIQQKDYPQCRIISKDYELMELADIEWYIKNKLDKVDKYINAEEAEIPECTDEELWREPPKFKYYKDPTKLAKATKVFESQLEANAYCLEKGTGIVIPVSGSVRRCAYCRCFNQCSQKNRYLEDGSLKC